MSASEAGVKAVMETMGCLGELTRDHESGEYDAHCEACGASWTDRGCALAVASADGAIEADRASIQAEALREAADVWANGISVYETWTRGTIARSLRARADRIEAKP